MTLQDYISEAISTGKHRSKYDFPDDYTDKDGIIEWLDNNGFVFLDSNKIRGNFDIGLINYNKRTGKNCYTIGSYINELTQWIRIQKGDAIYLIRTNGLDNSSAMPFSMYKPGGTLEEVDYDYIKDILEK